MSINNYKAKGTFLLGVMLIILISGVMIYDNKLPETLSENIFEELEQVIIQNEAQLYNKTQEKISSLIGKDVFIPITDRTFIHITFITLALAVILITQGIYVFLIQKEQTLQLQEQTFYEEFADCSNFADFSRNAEHLLKNRINTKINYSIIKLDFKNFPLISKHYGQAASNEFFKILAKLLHDLTNSELDTFAHINAEQFLLLVHCTTPEEFVQKKSSFDQALVATLAEFANSKVTVSEGKYDIPLNETDIISIFEKVNLAHNLVKNPHHK